MSVIIDDQEFFYRQAPVIEQMDLKKHLFMVGMGHLRANRTESKRYTSFPSEKDYEDWVLNFPPERRNFYEIIPPNTRVKEYYDIDEWPDKSISDKNMAMLWFHARQDFGEYIYKQTSDFRRGEPNTFSVKRENIIVLNASKFDECGKLTKGSLHIRHFGTSFLNTEDHKLFQSLFRDFVDSKPIYNSLKWDGCVYSKYRNIRLEGNTKCGQNRPLIRTDWFSSQAPSYITKNVIRGNIWNSYEFKKVQEIQEIVIPVSDLKDNDDIVSSLTTKILSGEHEKCDPETGLLTYINSLSFWFAVRDFKGIDYLTQNWNKLYTVYRHNTPTGRQGQLTSISNTEGTSNANGILFWAKDISSFVKDNKDNFKLVLDLQKTSLVKSMYHLTKNTIRHTDRYVDSSIFEGETKGILVSSGLGSGKSTSMIRHINKLHYDSILVLIPRRTYAKAIITTLREQTKYPFVSYLDCKGPINSKYVVCSPESSHRLGDNTFDLVNIDECESFLTQLTSKETNGTNHIFNIQALDSIISKSKKIMMMDAFLTDKSVSFLSDFNIPLVIHEYTEKINRRTATKISCLHKTTGKQDPSATATAFLKSILDDLEAKKKLFIFSTSKRQLEFMKSIILKKFPLLQYEVYQSKLSSSELGNVNVDWLDKDVIFTTSTITVGVDFNIPNIFHKKYFYISANSKNLIRDVFQASFRIRNLIDNEFVYMVDNRLFNTVYGKGRKDTQSRIDDISSLFSGEDKMPPWLRKIYIDNEHEKNTSLSCIEQVVDFFLDKCGYIKGDIQREESESNFSASFGTIFNKIRLISSDEVKILEQLHLHTPDQSNQLAKFKFLKIVDLEGLCSLKTDCLFDHWKISPSHFYNTMTEKYNIIPEHKYGSFEDLNEVRIKFEYIKEITSTFGLESTSSGIISRSLMKEKLSHFDLQKTRFGKAFNVRVQCKKLFTAQSLGMFLTSIFQNWNGSKIRLLGPVSRTRINGTRETTNDFEIIGLGIWDNVKFIGRR